MTKRCICEICTCGRHRCPHRPTNHISQGDGPCQLTEYTNVYKAHPLGPRENFKPNQQPMQGGEFSDNTNYRQDYKQHALERPHVHKPDEYVKPQGQMEGATSYNQEYVGKYAQPAKAIRNEGQRQLPAKFEGHPTYKADYRKWDMNGRQQPYGMQAAWEPPKDRFGGQSTFQSDYVRNEIPMRQSFKPTHGPQMSDKPFDDKTSHRDAYIQHPIPAKFQRPREEYKQSGAQFDGMSTFKRDYRGALGEPTHSFKPEGRAYQSDQPFDGHTTHRHDFKKMPMERPFVHTQEPYRQPDGDMDMNTSYKQNFREMPIERVAAMKPSSAKQSSAPFEGVTNYNTDYTKKNGPRAQPKQQAQWVPNQAKFDGHSNYKSTYVPHALQPNRSFRPDNQAWQSDAQFDDHTMYRQDYVPKQVQICEASLLDQSTSRYKYFENDARGHKLYAPIQTSITPLQTRSPMQSQQRLGMSVA